MKGALVLCVLLSSLFAHAQSIPFFTMYGDVTITVDTSEFQQKKPTIIIFYALPNGNTTVQTIGKKMTEGDDWHYDIQHVKAQTDFIREKISRKNIAVVYLENRYKSWPLWKQTHLDYKQKIAHLVDTVVNLFHVTHKTIYLNGHSGGGSFIFGYIEAMKKIPPIISRISFIDSDYGYDSSYYIKLKTWLLQNKKAYLTVFAYNDSVALYNGKPIVSAKGGTWYRSHLMLQHLQNDFSFEKTDNDSLISFESSNRRILFVFKTNPERKIYHTQQVELNGFIHSVLYGTKKENAGYEYLGQRAYTKFIR
ncbi:MAG: hypothetical protein ACTHOF_07570 [Flavisolibacter sp.]